MITELRFRRILSLEILLIVSVLLVACQPPPALRGVREVANPDSSLLPALVQRSEVVGDWNWISDSLRQTNDTPTSQNHNRVEHATHSVTGDYGTERYYVQINHGLDRFAGESPSPRDLKQMIEEMAKGDESAGAYTFSLNLKATGSAIQSECVSDNAVEDCWVAVQYNHLVSWLILRTAPAFADNRIAEDILNQVSATVDGRIREIDK